MLAHASARCPALLELSLRYVDLDQPPAALAQLTYLCLEYCSVEEDSASPLTSLALATPRLRHLSWLGQTRDGVADAAVPHLRIEQLDVQVYADSQDKPEEAWLLAASHLPALTRLTFSLRPDAFEGAEVDGGGGDASRAARLLRLCGWLGHCKRLEHLDLSNAEGAPLQEVLAAVVGASLGGRLASLSIGRAAMPPTPDAAARLVHMLVALYTRLRVLELDLDVPEGMDSGALAALVPGLLETKLDLTALCPALNRVEAQYIEPRGTWKAVWLRASANEAFAKRFADKASGTAVCILVGVP